MNNKSIFLSLFGALLSLSICAQSPVLTNQMISPIAGESFVFNEIDTTNVGTSGENQLWDYSNLVPFDDAPLMYITTEETMHPQYFPGANVASADENMCMFEFYQKSNDKLSYVGIYMDGLIMYFDDYKDALHYPFAYGDSFEDTFSTQYEQSTAMHHRIGTINAEADAYGTLMLPWGTLDGVLRVKTIEEMTDTFSFNNNPFEYHYNYETYAYYKPGIREPVLEFMYATINGGDTQLTGHYISEAVVNSIASIQENEMKLYPNPVDNQLTIETKLSSPITYCSITDAKGKLIWEDSQPVLPGAKSLPVENLVTGVYFVKIIAGDEFFIRKFIKK